VKVIKIQCFFGVSQKNKTMETEKLKQAMSSAIIKEVEQWAEESQQIKEGYEFEDRLLLRMRNIGKILMEQGIGKIPKSPNQKKSPHLPGGAGSR
jgi:hypothetical protein